MKGSQHKDPDPAMLATDRGGSIATTQFLFSISSTFREGKGKERKTKRRRRRNNKERKRVIKKTPREKGEGVGR